ncbi:hypothetical protein DFJ58DRAFT_766803 [Suillus subalutaceus]|uniref:uncharacterized protein n=1 Tax=Suillus subalutaceus TaxID=48586 RepID=UPI001B868200|nr:uncharacterized protein DFJ58DRAFT_766803 [Suillus subalutaceus]KAG1869043.1 hypothetical protein DFJ58DRAFT_766803 [Suillus subalutaceus]
MWDASAIVTEAGLDELLLNQCDKSVLAADATRSPVRQPIKVSNRVPQGFFDGTPHRAHSSARLDSRDTPSRPSIFLWVRNLFSDNSSGADIELRERHSAVDVPYAKGKRRNASARERRMIIIPLKPKNPAASTSRPPNSNVTQSSGVAHPQSSPQPQAAVSTSSTISPESAVTNTTPTTNPHIIIKHAGRWTRFWVAICCASSEYNDGHH